MKFGLSNDIINQLKEIFAKYSNIDKVVIYGSRAKGNYRKGSDIDLVLYGKALHIDTVFKLEDDIDKLYLPYMFDIAISEHIDNQNLSEHIARIGQDFYIKQQRPK